MNVLVFNPGSASLKFEVINAEPPTGQFVRGQKLLRGVIEVIGGEATLSVFDRGGKQIHSEKAPAPDHGNAASRVMAWLAANGAPRPEDLQLLGFRVVHGGNRYWGPERIDEQLLSAIEELDDLAPLHNAACLSVIRTCQAALTKRVPAVAVFDNGFHRTIPDYAHLYALPLEVAVKHKIRRYGFHGISHNYLMLRYAEVTGTPLEQTNIVTLHLSGGSSATAIKGGQSVDTSMGFTPLEGLVMGTRCGDLDPAIVGFLARKEGCEVSAVEELLNKRSGLIGISGRSQDTRVLVKNMEKDGRAQLALEIFSYRVQKYLGAYLAAMGGAAAVVFSGGIGENTAEVRRRVCQGLEWFGLHLDPSQNAAVIDREGRITREGSRVHAYVFPVEEGLMIAHEALRSLS